MKMRAGNNLVLFNNCLIKEYGISGYYYDYAKLKNLSILCSKKRIIWNPFPYAWGKMGYGIVIPTSMGAYSRTGVGAQCRLILE